MPTRPVALLTDFGTQDTYAGILRAVLHTRCPGVSILDLTHDVPPHDVRAGAVHLLAAAPWCPEDTVFLAVVDPGVGGARRPIALRCGTRSFVGPDNGLLWPAAESFGTFEAFQPDRPEFWLPNLSTTFHGRDIFAPVAAYLAAGGREDDACTRIDDPTRLDLPVPTREELAVRGEILLVDRFGNAVTNIRPSDLGLSDRAAVQIDVWAAGCAPMTVHGPQPSYESVPAGELLLIIGSLGYYEIARSRGSAAEELRLSTGDRITALPYSI